MRHALDPDHIAAISTAVAEERRLWPATRLGLLWGAGHLVPIALLGLPLVWLRLRLPETVSHLADLGVGMLLVFLGVRALLHSSGIRRGRGRQVSFLIGMAHGLAGSGAAAVLAMAAVPSAAGAVGYLLAFGLGTVAGMFLATLCLAAPALALSARFQRVQGVIRGVTGLASITVGLLMWVELLPLVSRALV